MSKKRPACFGGMYDLDEDEMCARCVLGGCRHFNDCKKIGGGFQEYEAADMPAEPAVDKEYRVKW